MAHSEYTHNIIICHKELNFILLFTDVEQILLILFIVTK